MHHLVKVESPALMLSCRQQLHVHMHQFVETCYALCKVAVVSARMPSQLWPTFSTVSMSELPHPLPMTPSQRGQPSSFSIIFCAQPVPAVQQDNVSGVRCGSSCCGLPGRPCSTAQHLIVRAAQTHIIDDDRKQPRIASLQQAHHHIHYTAARRVDQPCDTGG